MQLQRRDKILNSTWTFIAGVLLVGPLALPLLWRNRKYSNSTKILWTGIVLTFTGVLLWGSAHLTQALLEIAQP